MGKTTDAGIDVSKAILDVAVRRDERQLETARFANDSAGHKALVRWLTKGGGTVRVVLESTGTYSLDVALALHRTRGIAVMVANPRAIKQFTGALMQRSVQHNSHVRAFFDKLVARGKTPLQAYVAVMRKLLHAIYGTFTTRTPFVAAKFHAAA